MTSDAGFRVPGRAAPVGGASAGTGLQRACGSVCADDLAAVAQRMPVTADQPASRPTVASVTGR
jgi:hypothetical protein